VGRSIRAAARGDTWAAVGAVHTGDTAGGERSVAREGLRRRGGAARGTYGDNIEGSGWRGGGQPDGVSSIVGAPASSRKEK
jgi:hypothetical protein